MTISMAKCREWFVMSARQLISSSFASCFSVPVSRRNKQGFRAFFKNALHFYSSPLGAFLVRGASFGLNVKWCHREFSVTL